jgi:hypothetical protein
MNPFYIFLIKLSVNSQDKALQYVHCKSELDERYYNFHHSMKFTSDRLVYKPYRKDLTNNRL